jgi:hypothetical protein
MERAPWTSLGERIRIHFAAVDAGGIPVWLERRILAIPMALVATDPAWMPSQSLGAEIRGALEALDFHLVKAIACARCGDEIGLGHAMAAVHVATATVDRLTRSLG